MHGVVQEGYNFVERLLHDNKIALKLALNLDIKVSIGNLCECVT